MHSCAINIIFHGLIQKKRLGTSPLHPNHNVYARVTTDLKQEAKSLMLQAPCSVTQEVLSWVCKCCDILQSITSKDTLYNVKTCTFFTDPSPPNESQLIKPPIFQLTYPKLILSYFPPDTVDHL